MRRHHERTGRDQAVRHGPRTRWLVGVCCVSLGLPSSVSAAPPGVAASEGGDASEIEAPELETPEPEPATAGEWYARGIELGNAGDFVAAAAAFLRSYELQPTSEALFNAALAYQNAKQPIAAIRTYRRVLAEPEPSPELARAAEEAIARLLREVGTLKGIRYEPSRPPAELYVAGERHELDELPLLVPPGPLEIEVVDEAGERARETYEIAAGESLVVDVRALLPARLETPPNEVQVDLGPTPEEREATQRRELRARQLRTATWVGLGLTGAAGVSFGVLQGLAARERAAYLDATCLEFGGDCPDEFPVGDPEAHLRSYEDLRTGAIVSIAAAGGLAIGTLVVGLVSLRLERKSTRTQARARLRPRLGGFALEF